MFNAVFYHCCNNFTITCIISICIYCSSDWWKSLRHTLKLYQITTLRKICKIVPQNFRYLFFMKSFIAKHLLFNHMFTLFLTLIESLFVIRSKIWSDASIYYHKDLNHKFSFKQVLFFVNYFLENGILELNNSHK